jgi:hypothetical protein
MDNWHNKYHELTDLKIPEMDQNMDRNGQEWTDLDRNGQKWTEMERNEQK